MTTEHAVERGIGAVENFLILLRRQKFREERIVRYVDKSNTDLRLLALSRNASDFENCVDTLS